VDVFDAGIDPSTGMPFLVMELLQGEELGNLLSRTALTPEAAITYLRQVASALDKTHAAGIVHRDLKPENLFLTHREDGSPRVKILDFGISKVVNDVRTGAHATKSLGTPLYMAPEQVHGQPVGPATDLYSLALIAYTLLVGRSYWQKDEGRFDNTIAFVVHVTKGANESASLRAAEFGCTLPEGFDAWFRRATHLDPRQRFQRASELVAQLSALLGLGAAIYAGAPQTGALPYSRSSGADISVATPGRTGPGTQATLLELAHQRSKRSSWLLLVGVLGVGGLAVATLLHLRSERGAALSPSAANTSSAAPERSALVVPSALPAPASSAPVVAALPNPSAPAPSASAARASTKATKKPVAAAPKVAPARPAAHPGPVYTRD
jgi:serine/threonine-protein kinase